MQLGRGKVIKEDGLARIESTTNEHAQLWTYLAWQEWMSGCSWDELRNRTTPPEAL
jgi:3-phenylpropionate/trans-cinnamate dioxygenase alpha subunit